MRSNASRVGIRLLLRLACLLALAVAAAPVAPAGAAVVTDRPLLFSFDGSDATAGRFNRNFKLNGVAVDNSSGTVYVANTGGPGVKEFISKFNPDGTAATFSATGTSSLYGPPGQEFFSSRLTVAVDNSGGPSQGRIYFAEGAESFLAAFAPSGALLWSAGTGYQFGDVAVDPSGNVWIERGGAMKYANSGPPLTPIGSFPLDGLSHRLDFDASGNAYVINPGLRKYVEVSPGTWEAGPDLDPGTFPDLAVDQSTPSGHVFSLHGEGEYFNEFDSTGALVGKFGGSGEISSPAVISYNHALDRVYIADSGPDEVSALGPPITGTVPDPTIEPTDGIGVGKATFHGTVNPQGVANGYYFEWSDWCCKPAFYRSDRSPLQSLPEDSSDHPVSFTSLNLRGDTKYRVRLVTVNTDNGLHSASGIDEFETNTQTQAPSVTIDPVTQDPTAPCTIGIGSESACVSGTINPAEETLSWRVQLSTDPACASDFANQPGQTLLGEGRTTPVPVHFDLQGLLPAQHYCVRIVATNSFGGTTSEIREFTTDPVPPSETSAAFAAPRTDTTARINARLNPNGEADFEYRFEWSEDGSTWTTLPTRQSSIDAREPIIVAEELSGLSPDTIYHYRLALAQNEAGPAASLGQERTFTTRSAAEVEAAGPSSCPNADVRAAQHSGYLGACRGIELVNNPDKGNQNASARGPGISDYTTPISADGERLLWSVTGGAPGGPNGTESNFLAERSPSGWRSESAAPPAAEQVGGGSLAYLLAAATPDFGTFLFAARSSVGLATRPAPTYARVREGKQDILKFYASGGGLDLERFVDISDDGEHVLVLNPDTAQLEDIGAARLGPPEVPGEVVSLMPGGSPSQCGLSITVDSESFRGLSGSNLGHPGDRWIAGIDGSRVYFRARPDGNCNGAYGLYVRNREAGKTILIDPGGPEFLTATPDGHQAYFVTYGACRRYAQVAPFACEAPEAADTDAGSPDIYRWDEDAGTEGESRCLTCVTPVAPHLIFIDGGLRGVLISPDFSHIYFYSGQKIFPDRGREGARNLYALEGDQIRFVAVTSLDALRGGTGAGVSNDGNTLLFAAEATPALSADPMAAECAKPEPGGPLGKCEQLYLYDDREESIECVSCDHGATTTHSFGTPDLGTGQAGTDPQLSGDGTTTAFATQEALLAADVNGDTDLYEWRNGVLHLITDGVSDFQEGVAAPRIWGIDADGSDVFFGITSPGGSLTGYEQDSVLNVYDARIGGGFPPPTPPERCEGDSCQGPLLPAPAPGRATSADFDGAGNLTQAPRGRCHKPRVRRHGRCVKRHRAKRGHHRKQHRKGRAGR